MVTTSSDEWGNHPCCPPTGCLTYPRSSPTLSLCLPQNASCCRYATLAEVETDRLVLVNKHLDHLPILSSTNCNACLLCLPLLSLYPTPVPFHAGT